MERAHIVTSLAGEIRNLTGSQQRAQFSTTLC